MTLLQPQKQAKLGIVIGDDTTLEPSEAWTVQSASGMPACGPGSEQTDPKCAGQIAPILASITLLVQSTPTSVVRTTSEPSNSVTTVTHSPVQTLSATSVPSVPSSYSSSAPPSPECGGTPCFVYGLAGGLGALTLILLVAAVSVLVCIKLYLQRAKKIGSKFMFSPYALSISRSLWTAITLTNYIQLKFFWGIELSYFSIISTPSFPRSSQVMKRWAGPGSEAYCFTTGK